MRKGRFSRPVSPSAQRYAESVSFDSRLYQFDIAGSIAHATALADAQIITQAELEAIEKGLRDIEGSIESRNFHWEESLEDVHMNIETALGRQIGAVAGKLHTARSRNDQVALDLRLYVKSEIASVSHGVANLQRALLQLAQDQVDVLMPGYTHLQRAQPIPFAHYVLAHIEALQRDAERLANCLSRTDVLPLGSGALAGSTIVLDRELIARKLGFSRVSQNSVDAVSDRDFICEFLFCLAMIGLHLSRFSEDLILWSTTEFGFVEMSEAFSTGSSLMPQKKNPDMAELTRGKTGRLYGNLVGVLTMLKGLPTSYNRDLQEDKEALFDSVDTVRASLEVIAVMLPEMKINRARMEAAANDPNLLATDLAEHLVQQGVPFREAHEIVGKMAAEAAAAGTSLDKVPLPNTEKLSQSSKGGSFRGFDARSSMAERKATGAPSPENIAAQIEQWRKRLGS